MAQTKKYKSTN